MSKQYHLNIEGECLVCGEPATRVLNMRMRRPDTGASFGPNIDPAVFCEHHADQGADVKITFAPNKTGVVRFEVFVGEKECIYYHSMRDDPNQARLDLT